MLLFQQWSSFFRGAVEVMLVHFFMRFVTQLHTMVASQKVRRTVLFFRINHRRHIQPTCFVFRIQGSLVRVLFDPRLLIIIVNATSAKLSSLFSCSGILPRTPALAVRERRNQWKRWRKDIRTCDRRGTAKTWGCNSPPEALV